MQNNNNTIGVDVVIIGSERSGSVVAVAKSTNKSRITDKNMSAIKFLIVLIILLFIQSCSKQQLLVKEKHSNYKGLITQSISIKSYNDSKQLLLVCFSEIIANKLTGLSCQNDTGFHLFSGGIINGDFKLEKVSQFLLKIKPQTILNYLRLSLFAEYSIISKPKYQINVTKNSKQTMIEDAQKERIVEITVL